MSTIMQCFHCNEPIVKNYILDTDQGKKNFCCKGCIGVFQILSQNNLSEFYLFNSQMPYKPDYNNEAYSYLDSDEFMQKYIQQDNELNSFEFFIEGIHCTACLWLLEKLPKICDEADSCTLNMSSSVLKVKFQKDKKLSEIARSISKLGYRPHPLMTDKDQIDFAKNEDRKWLIRIAVAFACSGNIMLYSLADYAGASGFFKQYFNLFSFLCSIPVVTYCSMPFYRSSLASLKMKRASIDLPIAVSLIVGICLGVYSLVMGKEYFYFDTLSTLVFLLLLTRFLLKKAQQKTLSGQDLASFFLNKYAIKLDGQKNQKQVLTKFLKVGDQILVPKNQVIPIDGKIINGKSYINNSLLTGEVTPVAVQKDESVYMGAQNLDSDLEISVSKNYSDCRLMKILEEVEKGHGKDTRISQLAQNLAMRFIIFISLLTVAFFFYFYHHEGMDVAINRCLTLLVITCPCALALTTPLAFIMGLSQMAKMGVFIKNETVLERLSDCKNIFLDKTGTLTNGEFTVHRISGEGENLLYFSILWALEKRSSHPLAKSIVTYIEDSNLNQSKIEISQFQEIPGLGVKGEVNNIVYEVSAYNEDSNDLFSKVALYENGVAKIILELKDNVRDGTFEVLENLRKLKIKPHILSGDKQGIVNDLANALEFEAEDVFSEKSPEEKEKIISSYEKAIMVGDGINDAVALKSAYVGIAVKSSADVSLRASDVYMSQNSAGYILQVILASKEIMKVIYLNLSISFLYNLFGIYLTFIGVISPLIAAILMPISSLTILLITIFFISKIRKRLN